MKTRVQSCLMSIAVLFCLLSPPRSEAGQSQKFWAVLCQDGYTRGYVKDYKKGERLGAKKCDRAIYELVDAHDPRAGKRKPGTFVDFTKYKPCNHRETITITRGPDGKLVAE